MIEWAEPYRQAVPGDAPVMATLINMAGEGLPLAIGENLDDR